MTMTSIKKTLYISSSVPTDKSQSGYAALSDWKQIKGVVTIGSLGFNHATIDAPDLESGIITTLKGARQGVAASMAFRTIEGDAGQAAALTAHNDEAEVSLQVVDPDGQNAVFWSGVLHSLIDNEASVTSYEGKTFSFVPNYEGVKGAAAV